MATLPTISPIVTDKTVVTLTPVTGDVRADNLNVADDATIRGHATVKGNLRVEGWLDADNVRGVCKGLFASYSQLCAAYPHACDGAWAMVAEGGNTASLYIGHFGRWELKQEGFPIQFDDQQFRASLQECKAGLAAESAARAEADNAKASKAYVDAQLGIKADKTDVEAQLEAKANLEDVNKKFEDHESRLNLQAKNSWTCANVVQSNLHQIEGLLRRVQDLESLLYGNYYPTGVALLNDGAAESDNLGYHHVINNWD